MVDTILTADSGSVQEGLGATLTEIQQLRSEFHDEQLLVLYGENPLFSADRQPVLRVLDRMMETTAAEDVAPRITNLVLKDLTKAQLDTLREHFTIAQLHVLHNFNPHARRLPLAEAQLTQMTRSDVSSLPPHIIEATLPPLMALLSPEQAHGLEPKHIQALSLDHIEYLGEDIIRHLPDESAAAFTPRQLDAMTADQLRAAMRLPPSYPG